MSARVVRNWNHNNNDRCKLPTNCWIAAHLDLFLVWSKHHTTQPHRPTQLCHSMPFTCFCFGFLFAILIHGWVQCIWHTRLYLIHFAEWLSMWYRSAFIHIELTQLICLRQCTHCMTFLLEFDSQSRGDRCGTVFVCNNCHLLIARLLTTFAIASCIFSAVQRSRPRHTDFLSSMKLHRELLLFLRIFGVRRCVCVCLWPQSRNLWI